VVTFYSDGFESNSYICPDTIFNQLTEREKSLLLIVNTKGKISTTEYMAEIGKSRVTALKDLDRLVEFGIFEKKTINRIPYYIIKRIDTPIQQDATTQMDN
jgi:DeoR/GlpR family transcriptional regulator of sugar metabolism